MKLTRDLSLTSWRRPVSAGGPPPGGTPAAPSITASDSLAGRSLSITVDSLTGVPVPGVALATLTLDGADVSGEATATGSFQYRYDVPSDAAPRTVAWQLVATNTEGADAAGGSRVVPADLFAPLALSPPAITGEAVPGSTVTIAEGSYSGTPAPTITGALTLDGVDVTGDMAGAGYTIPAGAAGRVLEWSETASNGVAPAAQQDVSRTVGGAGSPFTPLDLFAGAEGAWYDPSDLGTLFQDAAGSVPVTADGQPVGRMLDKSGNGNHMVQASAARRPVYRTNGTEHWLLFDGVDDFLQSAITVSLAGTDKATFAFGVQSLNTAGANSAWISHSDDTDNFRFAAQAPHSGTNHFRVFARGSAAATADATAGIHAPPSRRLVTGVMDFGADLVTLRLDGVTVASASGTGATGNFRNEPLFLGNLGGIGLHANVRLYPGVLIGRLLTTGERDALEAFLAGKAGVAI